MYSYLAMSFALCYCLCFLCLLPSLIAAQNNRNITLGSSLTAGDESSWVSPSGDFAFGFQQVGTGGFLLAIWFNKIPEKTVTWSANRDALAQHGSKLQLNADGRLVLSDPNGKEVWSKTGRRVAYAALLNTGNFVLADNNSVILWQSFDQPTDTILPTQVINLGASLIAQFSDTNYSSGRFQLRMQDDGNLVFHSLNWKGDSIDYFAYNATSTGGSGYQVMFNQSGSIYVRSRNGSVVADVLSEQEPAQDLYLRAILEFDGVFRKYFYPRSNSTNWPTKWTMQDFQPLDICSQMTADEGEGLCGFNSYCKLEGDQKPKCVCPQGYPLLDQMKGCKQNFTSESCLEKSQENDHFQLEELVATTFYGSNYENLERMSEISCRNNCLSDCFCAAAIYGVGDDGLSGHCWKKRFPLSKGYSGPHVVQKTFIKVKTGNATTNIGPPKLNPTIQPSGGGYQEKKHRALILTESVLLGGSVFLNVLFLVLAVLTATFCTYKRKAKTEVCQDIPGTNMRSFSYRELEEATKGFKEVLGQGAFATVYKGLLDSEEGTVIAVKKLNELVKENQREFESELRAIARTGHRNLVHLIGFCNEQQHRLLVYEYMHNGSLADVLFHGQRPKWLKRIKYALETARGLNYLHEECSIQIIHCDIKPQNVLLDGSFTARISDFGLAKLLKKDESHTITGIRGTKGYVAPEWFKSMPITAKVDVYSYGILLLELVCCRRCFEKDMEVENQKVLADWAYDCYKEGRIDRLVESDYEALIDIENAKKLVMIALWCIQEDPSHRPSMNKVIQMINGALKESLPQDLASYISSMIDGPANLLPSSTEGFSSTD